MYKVIFVRHRAWVTCENVEGRDLAYGVILSAMTTISSEAISRDKLWRLKCFVAATNVGFI